MMPRALSRGLLACVAAACLVSLTAAPCRAWDWYAGDVADYQARRTAADIQERIQAAIDRGLDWLLLAGDERVGQYVGLGELLQEYELNAPRITPVLSAGWRDTAAAAPRLVVFGIDPRAPVPAGGTDSLLLWAGSHNGAVLYRAFPVGAAAVGGQMEAAFIGLHDGAWDPACKPGGAWDDRLTAGGRLFLIGSNGTAPAMAAPTAAGRTYVWAEGSEPAALIRGIRQGAAYVAHGDVARLDLRVNGTGMGGTASVLREAYVRIRVSARQPVSRVSLVADGEVVWTAQPDTVLWEERFFLPVRGRSYLRAVVAGRDGKMLTLGNPVFLAPESDIGQGEVPLAQPEGGHPEPIYLEIDGVLEVLSNLAPSRQGRVLGELLRNIELRYETARVLEVRKDLVPDPMLWEMLRDADPGVRLGAACALVMRGPVELPDLLVDLLDDPDREVRAYAARMLYQYTDGLPGDDVLPLLAGADPTVAGYLIRALPPTARSDSLTTYLIAQCRSPHRSVAEAAADQLLAMGTRDFRVIQALLQAARQGNDEALVLVGLIGDRRTLPELERIFQSASSGPLKRASFLGLARMGAPYIGRKELACAWLPAPPTVDGVLDSTEWALASRMDGFRGDFQAEPAPDGAIRAFVGRDTARLYLAVSCDALEEAGPRAAIRRRDAAGLGADRRIELAVAQPGGQGEPGILSVTPLGVMADRKGRGAAWDPDWAAVSRREPGRWSVECAVPFQALGIDRPEALQLLRVNLSLVEGDLPADRWAWSVTYGEPEDPSRFGDLLVDRASSDTRSPE